MYMKLLIPSISNALVKNITVENAPENGEISILVIGEFGGRAIKNKRKAFRIAGPKPIKYENKNSVGTKTTN